MTTIKAQCGQWAPVAGNSDTRALFAGLIPTVEARLQQNEREAEVRITREQVRVTLRGEGIEAVRMEKQTLIEGPESEVS